MTFDVAGDGTVEFICGHVGFAIFVFVYDEGKVSSRSELLGYGIVRSTTGKGEETASGHCEECGFHVCGLI